MYGLEKVYGEWCVFEVAEWLFDPLLHFTNYQAASNEAYLRNCRGD
jgi:hypothetical protein